MTSPADDAESHTIRRSALRPLTDLPLVQLVLISWNHAQFIEAAIASMREQDYPRLEFFVVDNASTDNSRAIIERETARDPRFTRIFLPENLNQLGALLHILGRLRGDLIAVVDSDDFLLAGYVSSHVQVHMSAPGGLGLTSNSVIEVDASGRIVAGKSSSFSPYRKGLSKLSFAGSHALRVPSLSEDDYTVLMDSVFHVSADYRSWVWSAGTANMYRREILQIGRPVAAPEVYVAAVDNYYAPFGNALASSALIDLPLSAYRIHGGNRFATTESIEGVRGGSRPGVERAINRRRDMLATFCSDPDTFYEILGDRFWDVMDVPSHIDVISVQECYESEQVRSIIAANYSKLCATLGEDAVVRALRDRMSHRAFRSLAKQFNQPGN